MTITNQTQAEVPTISVNIPLPAELHRRLKIAAASEGITVKEAVIASVSMWVTNG